MKNYYSILNVKNFASIKEIKAADNKIEKTKMKKSELALYHEIYKVLTDRKTKKEYDQKLKAYLKKLETIKATQNELEATIKDNEKKLEELKKKKEENAKELIEFEKNNAKNGALPPKKEEEKEIKKSDAKKKKASKINIKKTIIIIGITLGLLGAGHHIGTWIKSNKNEHALSGDQNQTSEVVTIEENYGTPENIYDKIETIQKENNDFAPSITSVEDIYELMLRIEDNDYTGYLTYTDSYMIMKELMVENFDVAELYYNTPYYENMNQLSKSFRNMDTTNDTLTDEYEALSTVNSIVKNATNANSELTGYLAHTDYYIKETGITIPTACGVVEGGSIYNNVPDANYRSGDDSYAKLQNTLTKEQQEKCMSIYKSIDPDSNTFAWKDAFIKINEIDNAKRR